MGFFEALILGLVEGVTEFLPISSTGHLILAAAWLGLQPTEFLKSFEIFIQLGAIAAVGVLYGTKLLQERQGILKILTGFLPTALLGVVFYAVVKRFLLGNALVVGVSLVVGGVLIILFERFFSRRTEQGREAVSYRDAFLIGVMQSVALVPGVSRSAASILGGLGLGLTRRAATEFSFLLAIPTLLGAVGLDLLQSGFDFTTQELVALMIGFFTSFIVAVVAIRFLLKFITTHTFAPFGWYRIVVGLLVFVWLF